ncbi:oligosaccharide flippase family protein [soil metagenome]
MPKKSEISAPAPQSKLALMWTRFLADPLAISGSLLVFAGVFSNFLNFLGSTYLTRSQVVTFDQLGVVGLIAGFNTFSDLVFGAINKTVMYQTAFLLGKHNRIIKGFWEMIFKYSLVFGVAVTIIWCFSVPFLSHFFSSQTVPLLLTAPAWLLTLIIVVNDGFLTGAHKFILISVLAIAEAAIKLLTTILFVQLGHPELLYLAFPLSLLSTFIIGTIYIARFPRDVQTQEVSEVKKVPYKYFVSSLGFKISGVLLLAGDVLLAKHYLSPSLAGEYILLSTIGKMVFFFGSVFTTLISPLVSRNEGANKNSQKIFWITLILTLLANTVPVLVIGVFGYFTIPLIFSTKGAAVITYLLPYTIAMSFFSIAGVITNYHQARKHNSFSVVSLLFGIFQTVGIMLYDHSIFGLVSVVLATSLAYLVTLLSMHIFYEAKDIKKYFLTFFSTNT